MTYKRRFLDLIKFDLKIDFRTRVGKDYLKKFKQEWLITLVYSDKYTGNCNTSSGKLSIFLNNHIVSLCNAGSCENGYLHLTKKIIFFNFKTHKVKELLF